MRTPGWQGTCKTASIIIKTWLGITEKAQNPRQGNWGGKNRTSIWIPGSGYGHGKLTTKIWVMQLSGFGWNPSFGILASGSILQKRWKKKKERRRRRQQGRKEKSKVVVKINAASSRYDPWNGRGIPTQVGSTQWAIGMTSETFFDLRLHFDVEVREIWKNCAGRVTEMDRTERWSERYIWNNNNTTTRMNYLCDLPRNSVVVRTV